MLHTAVLTQTTTVNGRIDPTRTLLSSKDANRPMANNVSLADICNGQVNGHRAYGNNYLIYRAR